MKIKGQDKKYPLVYKANSIPEVEFQMRKLLLSNLEPFNYHQWPREDLRWAELMFSLLLRIDHGQQEETVRDVVGRMVDLGMLNVKKLALMYNRVVGDIDLKTPDARRIYELLSEYGFSHESSIEILLVMHEAAKSLLKNHHGKIQKYLRKYGELMIDELSQNFKFTKMSKDDVRFAFTFWLQNVTNMPISLHDQSTREYCDAVGLKPEQLVEEADELDVNLAVVDDIIDNWNFLKNEPRSEVIPQEGE